VQKGGSSFLTRLLARCPGVCIGETKEPHVFSLGAANPLGNKNKSASQRSFGIVDRRQIDESYRKHFAKCPMNSIRVDATPHNWIKHGEILSVYDADELSTKKFVVVLRDPIDREFSWYNHQLRACAGTILKMIRHRTRLEEYVSGRKPLFMCDLVMKNNIDADILAHLSVVNTTASKLLKMGVLNSFAHYVSDMRSLRGDSLYLHHLRRWLSVVPRKNFLILNFDASVKNHSRTIDIITDFLSDSRLNMGEFCKRNATGAALASTVPKPPPRVHSSFVLGAELDCKSNRDLKLYFDSKNSGLYDFINNNFEKPKSEPTFSSFESKYTCV
jgi:hypothetical protein